MVRSYNLFNVEINLYRCRSEFCCDFKFFTSKYNSDSKKGDIALITKKKPASLAGALAELVSDADNYQITFSPEASLDAGQRATVVAAQLLADYMFFDGNTEKCKFDDRGCFFYCFYCSIIGKLFPCYIFIPKNK